MFDKDDKAKVTVEDTLQILFVRYGRDGLNEEINQIFGDNEKNEDGREKEITYPEYVAKINRRALDRHAKEIEDRRTGKTKQAEQE